MNKPFSVYLDLVRFIAACLVYIYHSNQRLLITDILPVSNFGHSSVIVFFVLSGFVIAYVTDTKENNWVTYAASRLSRVYSVALPAVFITVLLDAIGRQLYPELYGYPFDYLPVRIGSSLLLLNEWWFVSITSFSNIPYWSICYEAWYYVAFGLITFVSGRVRFVALVVLTLFLGPKILLLAPIWWAGVLLYRWQALKKISVPLSWALVIISTLGILLFHAANSTEWMAALMKTWIGSERHAQLTFSKFFLTDYLLGLLVFLNFAGMRNVAPSLGVVLLRIERPVRIAAGYTFTLYLLHQPLFLFWGAVIHGDPGGAGYWIQVTLMVGFSVVIVGYFTEGKRYPIKCWIERQLNKMKNRWVASRYAANQ